MSTIILTIHNLFLVKRKLFMAGERYFLIWEQEIVDDETEKFVMVSESMLLLKMFDLGTPRNPIIYYFFIILSLPKNYSIGNLQKIKRTSQTHTTLQ